MSWLITFLSGILGLILGTLGMFAIAIACVTWYRISSFEGKSGFFVIGLSLLGAIFGFMLAVIAARLSYSNLSHQWYSQFGSAFGVVIIALAVVLAFAYVGVDRIPELDGQGIDSVWEIRLPVDGTDKFVPSSNPRDWPDEEIRLELVNVSNHKPRGSRAAKFDRDAFRQENGQWILVARVPLFTSKGEYCVNLTLGGRDDGFWPAMQLRPKPGCFEWSPWTRTNKGSDKVDDTVATMYRFKLAKATE